MKSDLWIWVVQEVIQWLDALTPFFLLPLFACLLSNWEPLKLLYWPPWHNIKCCLQSEGHVLFLWRWVVGSCQVGGGLVPPCQISLAWVRMEKFTTFLSSHVHILVISFWCSLASICWQCAWRNPTQAWYCNTSCQSNLWWVCTLF